MELSPADPLSRLDCDQNFYSSTPNLSSPADCFKKMEHNSTLGNFAQQEETKDPSVDLQALTDSNSLMEMVMKCIDDLQNPGDVQSHIGGGILQNQQNDFGFISNTDDAVDLPSVASTSTGLPDPQYYYSITQQPPSENWQCGLQQPVFQHSITKQNLPLNQCVAPESSSWYVPVHPPGHFNYSHNESYQYSGNSCQVEAQSHHDLKSHLKSSAGDQRRGRRRPFNVFPTTRVKVKQEHQQQLTPEEEAKRRERKEKNKKAATRCRLKKQEERKKTEVEEKEFEIKNTHLKQEIENLRAVKAELEHFLATHPCALLSTTEVKDGGLMYSSLNTLPFFSGIFIKEENPYLDN